MYISIKYAQTGKGLSALLLLTCAAKSSAAKIRSVKCGLYSQLSLSLLKVQRFQDKNSRYANWQTMLDHNGEDKPETGYAKTFHTGFLCDTNCPILDPGLLPRRRRDGTGNNADP